MTDETPTRTPGSVRARGSLDACALTAGEAVIGGWLLHPRHPVESVAVSVNGVRVGTSTILPREDVAEAFPHLAHAGRCGFNVRGAAPAPNGPLAVVTVEGCVGGTPVATFVSRQSSSPAVGPVPHETLRARVAGAGDADVFRQTGLDAASDLMDAVARHRSVAAVRDALDWGCGCGRVAAPIAARWPDVALRGCDLDAEAVAWCNEHLRARAFHVTGPYPPLPFADASFDVVFACSVMTHLAAPVQRQWLPEVRRILRPGGLFMASVHGRFAAAFFADDRLARLERRGIVDDIHVKSHAGIAPRGYYRGVYQTPEYTRRHWSEWFEVLEYGEGGLSGWQDLVVLRRKT